MSKIEVREERKEHFLIVRIDPLFDPENKRRSFQPKVTAHTDRDYSFEDHEYHWGRVSVSWYSSGGSTPDEAEAFSKSLALAVEWARKVDAEHGYATVKA